MHRTVTTTTLLHASLLSINPNALKLNAAQELKARHVKMHIMFSGQVRSWFLEAHADCQHLTQLINCGNTN